MEHARFYEAVSQIIPIMVLVLAIDNRRTWGRAPGTYNFFYGIILLLAVVGETLVLAHLWGYRPEHNRHFYEVFTKVCVWGTLIALAAAVLLAAQRPREPSDAGSSRHPG